MYMSNERSADFLRGNNQERAHTLRADVITKLAHSDAIVEGSSWAIFHVPEQGDVDLGLATKPDKKVLVMLWPDPAERHNVPIVRIITNEEYISYEGERQCLTTEFSLDSGDNSLYHIDAVNETKYGATAAPMFWIDGDGQLALTPNLERFTPFEPLREKEDGQSHIVFFPFGHVSSIEDAADALAVGRDIFNEIGQLEPTYYSQAAS
jgi:hypothetical protein